MRYNKNEVTGKMRDRIILQNVTRVRSLSGYASESWADITTLWAYADTKLGPSNENIIDGKNTAKNVTDFTIRYISQISEESRIVWGDKLYQVKNIKVSHDRRFVSFQGIFFDSYIITGVQVSASVNGIATTSANLKLIMSVIGQANAIASAIGDIIVFQQGVIEVAASVTGQGTTVASSTIVQNVQGSVNATGNTFADVTVTTQGVTLVDASVQAIGTATGEILRIVTLESSASTVAETTAIATLTKVLEANATATAETNADAQLTIPVNASASATAETNANAQLSYTVNAAADATAETSAEAQIVRIISAEATATAESTAEASFGITFSASVTGTANVEAVAARTANMAASVTASATVTNATLNVTAVDPHFANVSILLHGTGTNGQTTFIDSSLNNLTLTRSGNTVISTSRFKFNSSSIYFAQTATDLLNITNQGSIFQFPANFTLETFINSDTLTVDKSIFVIGNSGLTQIFALNFDATNFNIYLNNLSPTTISHGMIADIFHHVAMVRNGSTITLYVDGNSRGTITNSSTLGFAAGQINLLRLGGGLNDAMYVDEFRITKGVARYTANFTPPTQQFPDQ